MTTNTKQQFLAKNNIVIAMVIIGVMGRLIPHLPNATPLTSLSLFAGAMLSRRTATFSLFVTLLVSDIVLALLFSYPVFGYWTLFTYTGFMTISVASSRLQNSWKTCPPYILCSSLLFFGWTNFGAWLTSSLYPKTLTGLGACYIAALPFLRNSLIGDMAWGLAIFGVFYFTTHSPALRVKATKM